MSHQVIMHQVFVQRSDEAFVTAIFQTYAIVYPSVVDQAIDAAEDVVGLLNGTFTSGRIGQVKGNLIPLAVDSFEGFQVVFGATADDDRNGAFAGQGMYYARTDTTSAARNDDGFVL